MNTKMTGRSPMKHYHMTKYVFTDVDYKHTKKICEDFEIKNFGE